MSVGAEKPNGQPLYAPPCRVGENNGIRFPREFALLIKQLLYFDRQAQCSQGRLWAGC